MTPKSPLAEGWTAYDEKRKAGEHGRVRIGGPTKPGRVRIAKPFMGSAITRRIIKSVGAREGDDAADHINAAKGLDTFRAHTDANGTFSPERTALHMAIIAKFLAGHKQQENPEALFTAGGPASGKTSLIDNLPSPEDHVAINPDLVKEELPEYQELKAAGRDDIAGAAAHEESSHIAAMIAKVAMQSHRNIVIDGVGDSGTGKFAGKLEAARDNGYATTVRYAHIPVGDALEREQARAARTGRHVAPEVVINAHKAVSDRYYNDVRHVTGINIEVRGTHGPKGSAPTLISHTRDGKTTVTDEARQREFEEKRLAGNVQEARRRGGHKRKKKKSELRTPPDSATYLVPKGRYPKGTVMTHGGKKIDMNAPGPFEKLARTAREAALDALQEDVAVKAHDRITRSGRVVHVKSFNRRGNARALRTVSLRNVSDHPDTPGLEGLNVTDSKLTRPHMRNVGPTGKERNVSRMGADKLGEILNTAPVNSEEHALLARVRAEVTSRGGLVDAPGGKKRASAGAAVPKVRLAKASGKSAPPSFVPKEHHDLWDEAVSALPQDEHGNPRNYAAATAVFKAKLLKRDPEHPWLQGRKVGNRVVGKVGSTGEIRPKLRPLPPGEKPWTPPKPDRPFVPFRAGTGPDTASPLFDHKAALDRLWSEGTSPRAKKGILDGFEQRSDSELGGMEHGDLADLADAAEQHGRSDFAGRVDRIRTKGPTGNVGALVPKAPKAKPAPKAKGHGGFKVGDTVTYESPSVVNGKVEGYAKQPGTHTVVGLQRNGNLRLRSDQTGASHDVHHSHAQKAKAKRVKVRETEAAEHRPHRGRASGERAERLDPTVGKRARGVYLVGVPWGQNFGATGNPANDHDADDPAPAAAP